MVVISTSCSIQRKKEKEEEEEKDPRVAYDLDVASSKSYNFHPAGPSHFMCLHALESLTVVVINSESSQDI